ncbi:MAG: J domain-containing protein [Deltaproteobacteria bacterium]|nr:J domain-containing protein [Deltaproteobacteria bacterium]
MEKMKIIPTPSIKTQKKVCLSCGTTDMKRGRRYCSKACRQQILWVLSLSKGLLKVFNARYAAFSFNNGYVMLDVLPAWSNEISRFVRERASGKKPAETLKELILQSGAEWYQMISNNNSKSYASLCMLKKNHVSGIEPRSIRPDYKIRPKFSRNEKIAMKMLQLKVEELVSFGQLQKIRSSYKKLAKIYHPDIGGDEEMFKKLNEAHEQMLMWAENPQFTSRKALANCWSYDGSTNRWTPPL